VGGVVVCIEWAYKGFDSLYHKWEGKGARRSSSAAEGLLNGVLEKEG
jgi:hypothetical protein